MNTPRLSTRNTLLTPQQLRSIAAGLSAAGVLALAGCGGVMSGNGSSAVSPVALRIRGSVHGGQQPVTGATIQLYTVGTSGLRSASTPMLTASAQSDAQGNFDVTNLYSCATVPATQVYLTATGGNPGAGTNTALAMVAALGSCSAITAATFVQINEISTIGAAYALAPFASDLSHIGATGSNPTGLVNAFANAALISNVSSGTAGAGSVANGVTVPISEMNTLGDIIAACINTTGIASAGCTSLFSATGASDTFGAALGIAKNPGTTAVRNLFSLVNAAAPFQPTLSSTPNDFTVGVTMSAASGLATPYSVAIDAAGNAWIANEGGTKVTELSVTGTPLATPTAPNLFGAQGIAVDRTGNVWVANTAGNSVVKFTVSGGAVTATNSFTVGGILAPSAIALDSAGNAFVANFNGNSVTGLNSAGAALTGSPFTGSGGNITVPTAIAVGPSGSVYVTSGGGSVVNLTNAGAFSAVLTDGTLQAPGAISIDATGRISATGFTTGAVVGGALSQFTAAGAAVASSPATSGLVTPAGVATDGISVFVANGVAGGSLAQFVAGSSTVVSPASGYGALNNPVGVAIDASGSVWTANSGSNTMTKFIGLAAPVSTPIATTVGP